jgi:hypothetical protein
MDPTKILDRKHPLCYTVLGLATDLEACLRDITRIPPRSEPTFRQLLEEHKDKGTFSDWYGVLSAKYIRNRISHRSREGSPITVTEVERAKTTLEHALQEVLPSCSIALRDEIKREAVSKSRPALPQTTRHSPSTDSSSPTARASASHPVRSRSPEPVPSYEQRLLYRRFMREIDTNTRGDTLNKRYHWRSPDTCAEIKYRRRALRNKFDLIRRWDVGVYREFFLRIRAQLSRRYPQIDSLPQGMVIRLTHTAMFIEMQRLHPEGELGQRDAQTWHKIMKAVVGS